MSFIISDGHIKRVVVGSSAETKSLLIVGCVLLLVGAINECFTSRSPIIPPRLFKVKFSHQIITSRIHFMYIDAHDWDYLGVSVTACGCLFLGCILLAFVLPSLRFLCHRSRRKVRNNHLAFMFYSDSHEECYRIRSAVP